MLVYKGDVDEALAAYIVWVDQQIANINGTAPPPGDPNVALIGDAEDLSKAKLAVIKAEMLRLEKFISADTVIQKQYAALASRVSKENKALATLQTRLTDAKGAAARRKDLQTEREAAYGRVFDAIISEQSALMVLYAPLVSRLANSSDTLRKLSFSVSRVVDAKAWAEFAESQLIDCRKKGPSWRMRKMRKKNEPADISLISQKQSAMPGCVSQSTSSASADENDRLLRIDEAARRLNPSERD